MRLLQRRISSGSERSFLAGFSGGVFPLGLLGSTAGCSGARGRRAVVLVIAGRAFSRMTVPPERAVKNCCWFSIVNLLVFCGRACASLSDLLGRGGLTLFLSVPITDLTVNDIWDGGVGLF